jgi:hypothetical protein
VTRKSARNWPVSEPFGGARRIKPETVSKAPKSAWGDEVGPRASADGSPETRFPARRSRFATGQFLAEAGDLTKSCWA